MSKRSIIGIRPTRTVVVLGLVALMVWIALRLEILVDDAFITFRYVANARDGHGLVWNLPPFAPVEGYTSLLWALVLWATWSVAGVEPPVSANWISLGCGVTTFLLCAAAAGRLRDRDGQRAGTVVIAAFLAALATNRTFVQWLTSGLETALFDLLVVLWVLVAFRRPEVRTWRWLAAWSTTAALAALTRPDGLLLVAVTLLVVATMKATRALPWRILPAAVIPLAIVAAHLLWRHGRYGDWLPNTYYAKVVAPWPEAGARYLFCFAFETGFWLLLPLPFWWLAVRFRTLSWRPVWWIERLPPVGAVLGLLAHTAYYLFVLGGDHFEYRVLSHLVPLLLLSATAMLLTLRRDRFVPTAFLLAVAAASGVGWYQLAVTGFRIPPAYDPLAPHLPPLCRPIGEFYDRQKLWLTAHMIGIRFQHGIDRQALLATFPERRRRSWPSDDVPVLKASAVGVIGWVLPDLAILDTLGLNDWVTARSPTVDWSEAFFPKDVREVLQQADGDGDGIATSEELRTALTRAGFSAERAADSADFVLRLMAANPGLGLQRSELATVEAYLGSWRLMAHDHLAPDAYVAAFSPNVVLQGRDVVTVPRAQPLGADAIRAIEAAWRQKIYDDGR